MNDTGTRRLSVRSSAPQHSGVARSAMFSMQCSGVCGALARSLARSVSPPPVSPLRRCNCWMQLKTATINRCFVTRRKSRDPRCLSAGRSGRVIYWLDGRAVVATVTKMAPECRPSFQPSGLSILPITEAARHQALRVQRTCCVPCRQRLYCLRHRLVDDKTTNYCSPAASASHNIV